MSFSSSNSALVTELLLKCYGANASREENTSKSKAVGNGHTKLLAIRDTKLNLQNVLHSNATISVNLNFKPDIFLKK